MPRFNCYGWWEQLEFGRQLMDDFQISFADGRFDGQGTDIVGPFVISGSLAGPQIELRKQYIGKHEIIYRGTGDGEGVYSGLWTCNQAIGSGRWLIRFVSIVDQ